MNTLRGGIFLKKVWYLEGKENKKKKTVKLFVYEKEKVPTAHLDLSAFAELAQYDDWTIRFFHKDAPVLKEIISLYEELKRFDIKAYIDDNYLRMVKRKKLIY